MPLTCMYTSLSAGLRVPRRPPARSWLDAQVTDVDAIFDMWPEMTEISLAGALRPPEPASFPSVLPRSHCLYDSANLTANLGVPVEDVGREMSSQLLIPRPRAAG